MKRMSALSLGLLYGMGPGYRTANIKANINAYAQVTKYMHKDCILGLHGTECKRYRVRAEINAIFRPA
jgi:hypothetical protein